MRFDLRLFGMAANGRPVIMELTVFAQSQKELMERSKEASAQGPWYYRDNNDAVEDGAHITVESVKQLREKQDSKAKRKERKRKSR